MATNFHSTTVQGNHDPSVSGTRVEFVGGAVFLYTGQAYRPGQEVDISYGQRDNEDLLLNYGFVVPNNEADRFTITDPLALLKGTEAESWQAHASQAETEPLVLTRALDDPSLQRFTDALQEQLGARGGGLCDSLDCPRVCSLLAQVQSCIRNILE